MKKTKIEEEEEEERERLTLASATYSEAEAIMSSYHLSEDIMVNILSRLPVKSIKRFRCVCKLWDNLFKNPNFINMHHNHGVENENFNLMITEGNEIYSSIDNLNYCNPSSCLEMAEINHPFKNEGDPRNEINIWGACNGLLCLTATCSLHERIICIWNPSTKEYKRIPFPPDWSKSDADDICSAYGLGYDCNIGDYKLVFIMNFSYDIYTTLCCQVKVFTLGSNSWKHNTVIYPYGICSPGVIVNGTLHWVASDRDPVEGFCVVVSFDFGAEEFMEVPMPEHWDDDKLLLNVSALGGCLCIYGTRYDEDCFEVWVMKDYGVRESWTKLFNVAQQSLGSFDNKLIQPFKNDEYLLYIESEDNTKDSLVVYNPKKERVRALNIHCGYRFSAMTYVESLFPLDTGTYVVQERVAELKDYDEKEEKQEKDDVESEKVR